MYFKFVIQLLAIQLLYNTVSLYISLRFNGHFPDEPGLAGVY